MAETPTAQTASLEGIEGELLGAIAKAADLGALEEVRVAALGLLRLGLLSQWFDIVRVRRFAE